MKDGIGIWRNHAMDRAFQVRDDWPVLLHGSDLARLAKDVDLVGVPAYRFQQRNGVDYEFVTVRRNSVKERESQRCRKQSQQVK